MDTALPQKFPFIPDRNLAKAKAYCTGNRVCTSCDIVVLDIYIYIYIGPTSSPCGCSMAWRRLAQNQITAADASAIPEDIADGPSHRQAIESVSGRFPVRCGGRPARGRGGGCGRGRRGVGPAGQWREGLRKAVMDWAAVTPLPGLQECALGIEPRGVGAAVRGRRLP